MNLESNHPAQRASFESIKMVSAKNKEGWLALFADDAVVQDPVGKSPLDPVGEGHKGKAAIGAFWDMIIAGGDFKYRMDQSFPCGDECANVWVGINNRPDGTVFEVPMVTIYKVNAQGKLVSLRAFWDTTELVKAFGG